MNLNNFERENPLWLKIEGHLKERLALLRSKNDGPLDAVQTSGIRGQIAELKVMLAWGIDVPKQDLE